MNPRHEVVARILETIQGNRRFVLTTHVHADGDGIGSELALFHHLAGLGKEVQIINPTPMPEIYRFLDPEGTRVEAYREQHARTVREADALFLLDVSDASRLDAVADALSPRCPLKICIDHHPTEGVSCDLAWIDDHAAATGELVYALVKEAGHELSPPVAEGIYVALMTDTGSFRYANVTAETHRVAAELLETGIDHHRLYRLVYESNSWNQARLFARTVGDMRRACNDRVAWMRIPREAFRETGTREKDTEGLVEFPRSIGEVQISILFIEQAEDRIRVRFRSPSPIAVDGLARELGGGGHRNAAAALLAETSLDEAVEKVLTLAERYVR